MPFIDSLTHINARDWDRLQGTESPFLRHAFLCGLEATGCTVADTGWQPHHWVAYDDSGQLNAALPCYIKTHSFGEYVFDWAWAEAWAQHGLDYYPKLLSAVPFTPSRGPRLLLAPESDAASLGQHASQAIQQEVESLNGSSWHLLYPDEAALNHLQNDVWMPRLSCQFHWHNRDFVNFEAFLATLKARKRKQIHRERNQIAAQGIRFERLRGAEITDQAMDAFFVFYQATYLKRGQRPYLNKAFFRHLREAMPEHLYLVMALHEDHYCAAALFLYDRNTLFGRYWGCLEEYDQLHFEACYYQGIDFCIEEGIKRFDAGAQGEHKLKRGFEPELFESYHWVHHPGLQPAVADFCRREAQAVRAYARDAATHLPFRED